MGSDPMTTEQLSRAIAQAAGMNPVHWNETLDGAPPDVWLIPGTERGEDGVPVMDEWTLESASDLNQLVRAIEAVGWMPSLAPGIDTYTCFIHHKGEDPNIVAQGDGKTVAEAIALAFRDALEARR